MGQNIAKENEQKVRIERTFVDFVHDDVTDAAEQGILSQASEQNAGGAEQDSSVLELMEPSSRIL